MLRLPNFNFLNRLKAALEYILKKDKAPEVLSKAQRFWRLMMSCYPPVRKCRSLRTNRYRYTIKKAGSLHYTKGN